MPKEKLTQEDVLIEMHEQFLREIEDAGIPIHLATNYSYFPHTS